MYGGLRLRVHMSLMFNMFLCNSFLPKAFMHSVIVPLVKCKNGDLSDVNNYRAICISTAMSKILEYAISDAVQTTDKCDAYQFGFKAGHSTELCTNVLKRTVDYFTSLGSHLFTCFIDFTKAFDTVNYWRLFYKLLQDGVNKFVVRLLSYWYCNQEACVRWKGSISCNFRFSNGTRQCGVLSPFMFSRYIRDMLCELVEADAACNIGGVFINVLAYADDLVLYAPTWQALQHLINLFAKSCSFTVDSELV